MSKDLHAKYEISQGAVIKNSKNQILILKLRDKNWVIPGGHLHKNEDWQDGLRREIFEETGIKEVSIDCPIDVSLFGSCYGICFECSVGGDMQKIILSDEHEDFAWIFSVEELNKYDFYHPVLKKCVLKVLEKML